MSLLSGFDATMSTDILNTAYVTNFKVDLGHVGKVNFYSIGYHIANRTTNKQQMGINPVLVKGIQI